MSNVSAFNDIMGPKGTMMQQLAAAQEELDKALAERDAIKAEYERKLARAGREIASVKAQAQTWAQTTFGDAHRRELEKVKRDYDEQFKALRVKSRDDNTFNSAKSEAYRAAIDEFDPDFFRPKSPHASGAQTTFLDPSGEVSVEPLMGAWYHQKGRGKSIMLPPHVFDTLRVFGEVWNHYDGTTGDVAKKTSAERAAAEKALLEYGIGKTRTQRLLSSARAGTLEHHGEDYVPQREWKPVVTKPAYLNGK